MYRNLQAYFTSPGLLTKVCFFIFVAQNYAVFYSGSVNLCVQIPLFVEAMCKKFGVIYIPHEKNCKFLRKIASVIFILSFCCVVCYVSKNCKQVAQTFSATINFL